MILYPLGKSTSFDKIFNSLDVSISGSSALQYEIDTSVPEHINKKYASVCHNNRILNIERRNEFLIGRYCVELAQINAGIPISKIGISNYRLPDWPEGLRGSVSHSNGMCVCILSDNNIAGIGVDVETIFTEEEALLLSDQISNNEEIKLMTSQIPFATACTIIFSLKESVFKAIYPSFHTYFGFDALLIEKVDVINRGLATIRIIGNTGNMNLIDKRIQCYFLLYRNYVITYTVINVWKT